MTTRRSGEHFLPRGSRRSVLPSGSLETRHHVPIYLRSNLGRVCAPAISGAAKPSSARAAVVVINQGNDSFRKAHQRLISAATG